MEQNTPNNTKVNSFSNGTRHYFAKVLKEDSFEKASYAYLKLLYSELYPDLQISGEKKQKYLLDIFGYILNDVGLDQIDVYIDESLSTKTDGLISYFFKNSKSTGIAISKDFVNLNFDISAIVFTLAHELKHAKIEEENRQFVKRININEKTFIPCFDKDNLKYLGFRNEDELFASYKIQINEKMANEYAFDFFSRFLSSIREVIDPKEALVFKLLYLEIKKMDKLEAYEQELVTNSYINHLANFQNKMEETQATFYKIILNNLGVIIKGKASKEERKRQVEAFCEDVYNLFKSFENYPYPFIFNEFKSHIERNYKTNPIYISLYECCLNTPQYVIKEEDVRNYFTMCKSHKIAIKFDALNLDYAQQIEIYYKTFRPSKNPYKILDFIKTSGFTPQNSVMLDFYDSNLSILNQ